MTSSVMYNWRVAAVQNALAQRGKAEGPLTVEDLTSLGHLDQYHYLGAQACDELIEELGLCPGVSVLDIGSGIGGPARYIAAKSGCDVTGVELQADLVDAAIDLTKRVGLSDRVRFQTADFVAACRDESGSLKGSFDHLISLLVFCHFPDTQEALNACFECLKPGGTFLIEDLSLVGSAFTAEESKNLRDVVHTPSVISPAGYIEALEAAGFVDIEAEILTEPWRAWTKARHEAFRDSKEETVRLHGEELFKSRCHFYAHVDALFAGGNLGGDMGALQTVVEAALSQRQQSVVPQLMSSLEGPQQHALLKALGSRGDKAALDASTAVFKACPEKSTSLYNTLLDACIVCQDMEAADRTMSEANAAGLADVITYNTIIKAFAQSGDLRRARAVVDKMRRTGGALQPNVITFNELIDATIRCNSEGVWALIDDMKACNLRPNHVTCSILLKNIQRGSRSRDIERTLAVVDVMEDAIDEVLLSSVCEACVRVGRADLLSKQLERQYGPQRVVIKGAHCFGSIVRAHGFLGDLRGALAVWREMRAQRIVPTSVTIGCMVEALVSNGDAEAGYELIHQMLAEPETKSLVNAVIYCSVLKGFSHQKQFDRVWVVYDEMIAGAVPFSVAAFNALVDTCARSCDMARVPDLIVDMGRQGIKPNVVTYSTILKGYCQENRLDKAFELLEEMKQSTEFRPDEITYNTLIDGCARFGLYDRGLTLLQEMQELGVRPSNFTLSVLAKLCTRGRRPEKAAELCRGLAERYGLQLNVQVYNNLLHACTVMRDMKGAAEVFEKMLREGVRADSRTYSLLIKGYLSSGMVLEAVQRLRSGLGLEGGRQDRKPSGGLVAPDTVSEVLEAVAAQQGTEQAMDLLKEARRVPGLKLDPKLHMRLASSVVGRVGRQWRS